MLAGTAGAEAGGLARRRSGLAEAAVDAIGEEDDEDDEQEAVDGLGHADELEPEADAEGLAERDGERGAHGGAEQRVHPAEDDREHDPQGHADPGQRVRVHVGDVLGVGDPAQRGERGGEHGDRHLEAAHVDSHRGGGGLVLADRLHRRPRHRAVEPVPHPEAAQPEDEGAVVEHALVRELDGPDAVAHRGANGHPERAARPVALGDDEEADYLAHREGDQPEVVADHLEARAGVGDDEGEHRGEPHCHHRPDPRREAVEVPQQRRGVGAEAEEGPVAERDEPEPAHERPRAADEGPDEDLHRHVDGVLAGDAEGQEGPREEHGEE